MLRADRARGLRSTAIGYHFAPLFTLNCLATDNFEDQRVAATIGKRKGRPKFVVKSRGFAPIAETRSSSAYPRFIYSFRSFVAIERRREELNSWTAVETVSSGNCKRDRYLGGYFAARG